MEPLQTVSTLISPLRPKSFADARSQTSPIPQISISGRENIPPTHPNVPTDQRTTSPSSRKKIPSIEAQTVRENPRSDALRVGSPDSSVKVVVRIRPVIGHGKTEDQIVKKISSDSLSVGDRKFTFTSVIGPESSQEDVFKLIGVPLVQSALAGYNASIVSYGQTGTGKTFTMWGPQSAMVDAHSISSYQGIVPRIFQMLVSEICKKQEWLEENNINYQCRCSFLEIYNEQIIDLLNPTQRNLQIHDDAKSGFYVENLTDEYINTIDDVTQILITGLSNRKVGATSMHSKSSRSHIIFTCTLESWCKGTQSKNFSSSKISKISLVDLAGLDKHKPGGVGEHTEDGRDVKQSLAKLGKLINILSGVARTGEDQKIPYMDSPLTHLLKDTLGGNAKVTYLCSISPDNRDKAATLSTLRFGELAKEIQNKAVINEISDDDFSGLSDQIRQLKEELIREKSCLGNSFRTKCGHFVAQNARANLNQLRVSLNRSLILPHIDIDSEEEIDVDMEDVRELCDQLQKAHASTEDESAVIVDTVHGSTAEEILVAKTDLEDDAGTFLGENKFEELDCETSVSDLPDYDSNATGGLFAAARDDHVQKSPGKYMLSIVPAKQFQVLHDPTLSESPKIDKTLKNGVVNSFDISEGSTKSLRNFESNHLHASLRSSKASPTESLAASLHRGLQIIDYHQQNSASRKTFLGLSFEQFVSKSHQTVDTSDASVQTSLEAGGTTAAFLCLSCRKMDGYSGKIEHENLDTKIVPVSDAGAPENSEKQVLQDKCNALADVSMREMKLEALCAEQADKIKQLKCMVDWCKDRHEQCSNLNENQGAKILCLEGLVDGAVYRKEEHASSDELVLMNRHLKNETKVSMEKYCSSKTSFDFSKREDLIKEIQTLKNQLKSYANSSRDDAQDYRDGPLLEHIRKGTTAEKTEDELERERQRWTESESQWICLTEELRVDLELYRQRAEKTELELSMEKRCSAELDDALHRAILGHSRIVEEYVELQEKHDNVLERYRKVMEGIAEVKKAAKKAGPKGTGSAFTEALAAELSTVRVERERERTRLKAENKGLKIQLRDTAEAVHAAGELLVRLREAEQAVSATEEKYGRAQQDNEKLRKQVEKLKRKHAMEMVTMKHYLAESRLPESALEPLYQRDSESLGQTSAPEPEDDHSWRAAFRPSYQ